MSRGDEIRAQREARRISVKEIADAIGISVVAYRAIESGKTRKSKYIPDVERYLEMAPHHKFVSIAPSDPSRPMPIMATAEDGKGFLIMSDSAIDYLARPQGLNEATDAYGLIVSGDEMAPRYRPGDLLLMHPKLPPRILDGVVLFEDGGSALVIREFVRQTPTEWVVKRWGDAPREETFPRKKWLRCHTVYGVLTRRT